MKNKIFMLLFVVLTGCATNEQGREIPSSSLKVIIPSMVVILGGDFLMGSPVSEAGRDSDERQHEVSVDSFSLSKFEVTRGEFSAFVNATGYITLAEQDIKGRISCREYNYVDKWKLNRNLNWRNAALLGQKQPNNSHPVVCVTWKDALAYIEWLNKITGDAYRLPTEVELEYVARAGSKSRFDFGEDESELCQYGNVADLTKLSDGSSWSKVVSCADGKSFTNEVGKYKPNSLGLYDVTGNVWEWTCSAFNKGYEKGLESSCVAKDYPSWISVRGGSYSSEQKYLRAANRFKRKPLQSFANSGFRLASD